LGGCEVVVVRFLIGSTLSGIYDDLQRIANQGVFIRILEGKYSHPNFFTKCIHSALTHKPAETLQVCETNGVFLEEKKIIPK
jgi:hypothetical protein